MRGAPDNGQSQPTTVWNYSRTWSGHCASSLTLNLSPDIQNQRRASSQEQNMCHQYHSRLHKSRALPKRYLTYHWGEGWQPAFVWAVYNNMVIMLLHHLYLSSAHPSLRFILIISTSCCDWSKHAFTQIAVQLTFIRNKYNLVWQKDTNSPEGGSRWRLRLSWEFHMLTKSN